MYVLLELQTNSEDVVATLVTTYDNRMSAESSFHSILASAAVSNLKKHAAVLMTNDGKVIRNECYSAPVDEE